MKTATTYLLACVSLVSACVLGLLLFERHTYAQVARPTNNVRLSVVAEPRPLARAADLLQRKLGVGISYEDPPWIYQGDLVEAANLPSNSEVKKTSPRFHATVPAVGSLDLSLPLNVASHSISMPAISVLQDLLSEHVRRGNPGEFKVLTLGGDFSIVPFVARDKVGNSLAVRSPLDFAVSFPNAVRDGMAALKTLCEAITEASGMRTSVGGVPKLSFTTTVSLNATNEPARDVLVRLLRTLTWPDSRNVAPIPKLSWRLYYDPEGQAYVLNIGVVLKETFGTTGQTMLVTVPR
jgi:hypothetical protein